MKPGTFFATVIMALALVFPAIAQTSSNEPFACKLETVSLARYANQHRNFENGKLTTKESGRLTVTVLVTGPAGTRTTGVVQSSGNAKPDDDFSKPPPQDLRRAFFKMEKMVDAYGSPLLVTSNCRWHQNTKPSELPESAVGRFQLEGDIIGRTFSRKIGRLSGMLWLPIAQGEDTRELKPLEQYIGKTVPLSSSLHLTINSFVDNTLYYKADTDDFWVTVDLYTREGNKVGNTGFTGGLSMKQQDWRLRFPPGLKKENGIYAKARFPHSIHVVAIPFDFTDVELPEELP